MSEAKPEVGEEGEKDNNCTELSRVAAAELCALILCGERGEEKENELEEMLLVEAGEKEEMEEEGEDAWDIRKEYVEGGMEEERSRRESGAE